jgi:transcriptional regulator with XRE-family HTH domain
MNFSQLLKQSRIEGGLTLRACAASLGIDPSNWSKMERSISPAPKDADTVGRWADFLGLAAERRQELIDLAAISRKEIPLDVASDARVIAALPVFFRAIRGQELEGERLQAFMEDLRAVHSPEKE